MFRIHETDNTIIAELIDEGFLISETQDALDMMGDASSYSCNRIIIRERNLHADFFILHTGFAGEILQKFSTYSIKLAIIGDFAKYKSKNLQDFIRESNRGNSIFFVDGFDEAMIRLAKY